MDAGWLRTGAPTAPAAQSELERRYRRLLRLLPRHYRDEREEEMLAVFLAAEQSADPDNFDITLRYGSPSWAERISIAALAVRLHWLGPSNSARAALRGRATWLFLSVYLLLAAISGAIGVISTAVLLLWPPDMVNDPLDGAGLASISFAGVAEFVTSVSSWLGVGWVLAWALGVAGGKRALNGAAAIVAVIAALAVVRWGMTPYSLWTSWAQCAFWFLIALGLFAANSADREPGRREPLTLRLPHQRRLTIGAVGVAAVMSALAVASFCADSGSGVPWSSWLAAATGGLPDEGVLSCWIVLIAAAVWRIRRRRAVTPAPIPDEYVIAAAAVVTLVFVARIPWLYDLMQGVLFGRFGDYTSLITLYLVVFSLLVATVGVLAIVLVTSAVRRWRALPD